MFEIAWSELFVVLIVAIIVVGPKDLPAMLRTLGRMIGKLRRSADDFRRQFDESMRDAGGEDLQRELAELRRNNPLNEIRNTIEQAARDVTEPPRSLTPDATPAATAPPETTPEAPASAIAAAPSAMPASSGAETVPAPTAEPAAKALPEAAASSKEQAVVTPGHEHILNGQHRPLN